VTSTAESASTVPARSGLLRRGLGRALLAISVLLIIGATLAPFDALFRDVLLFADLPGGARSVRWGPVFAADFARNLLLFVPFGACLTERLWSRWSLRRVVPACVLCSLALSYSVEVLQAFIPSRFPSLVDVLANTAGALVGLSVVVVWRSAGFPLVVMAGALAVAACAIPLQRQTTLRNWRDDFPLLVGNERTGDRPWLGTIDWLVVGDRAVTRAELARIRAGEPLEKILGGSLLALYRFVGEAPFSDGLGHTPDLVWHGEAGHDHQAARLASGWLQSTGPAREVSRRLRQTSAFTLAARVTSHGARQFGPARIISVSQDPNRRNFTLAQDGADLVFRVRTPFTGPNGLRFPLVVPDVFARSEPQDILVTYDGASLRLYVDGTRRGPDHILSPGAVALSSVGIAGVVGLGTSRLLFYALLFAPLGAAIWHRWRRPLGTVRSWLTIMALLTLPAAGLELALTATGRSVRPQDAFLGMLFAGLGCLVARFRTRHR
jgi:hypothetical protein